MDEKDNVAFSLLTNEHPLAIKNDDEDEEAEEDQRRRQQELQSMMKYAFDDIGDDENSTLNSSYDASSHVMTSGHQNEDGSFRGVAEGTLEEQYREASFNGMGQLQVLYQIQVRETQRLNAELAALQEVSEKERNGLKRQLMLLEAEYNGVSMSLKNCQDILVEKTKVIDTNYSEINFLKDALEKVKASKRETEEDVQIWKSKAMEHEQKLNLIEKGLYVPVSEKQIRAKYEQEIINLQEILEQTQKQLEQTQKHKINFENEIKDMKQSKDLVLMEKEEEIHSLYTQLENTKYQCMNLTDKIGYLEKEQQNLTNIINTTTKEPEVSASPPLKRLQLELKRSLEEQKSKRDEIQKLENDLEEQRNKGLNLMKTIDEVQEKNSELVQENTKLRMENEKIKSKVNELKEDIDKLNLKMDENGELEQKIHELEQECEEVKTRNMELSHQLEALKNDKQILEQEHKKSVEELNKKIQELEKKQLGVGDEREKLKILKDENEELVKQIKDQDEAFTVLKSELKNYESLCLELQETCAIQKTKLYETHAKITELESKLVLKEKRDELLEDLQQKALMFEEYIKIKSELTLVDKASNTEESIFDNEMTVKFEHLESALKDKNEKLEKILNENKMLKDKIDFNKMDKEIMIKYEHLDKLLKDKNERLEKILAENKTLKDKVVFDRMALNELTNVWNAEITRLNNLVKDLKQELENRNNIFEKKQEEVNEEIARMTVLINKLAESLRYKERSVKDYQEKEDRLMKDYERNTEKLKSDFQLKEQRLLLEFEGNERQLKSDFHKKEDTLQSSLNNTQKRFNDTLLEIHDKISSHMKYNHEKFTLETKIIEAYYDLLIQQAKLKKK